jgi:NDP-sugar pyrophosphorylase family protein
MVETNADGRITRFVEKPAPGTVTSNLANAGIYVLEPELLQHIPSRRTHDFGNDLFPKLLAAGLALYGTRTEGYLLDIGAPDRYWQAEVDFAARRVGIGLTPVGARG